MNGGALSWKLCTRVFHPLFIYVQAFIHSRICSAGIGLGRRVARPGRIPDAIREFRGKLSGEHLLYARLLKFVEFYDLSYSIRAWMPEILRLENISESVKNFIRASL